MEAITVAKNSDVSANCNICIVVIKSDKFKFIVRDDIPCAICIADNTDFVKQNQ